MEPQFTLPDAPGARASFHCGLWALLLVIICFPVSLALGIVAIIQNRKAAGLAVSQPEAYRRPGSAGMVMGIIAMALFPVLFFLGIISAIAIPAFLSQRARARDRAAREIMQSGLTELMDQYGLSAQQGHPPQEIQREMEALLRNRAAAEKNPWNPAAPAYSFTIKVATGLDEAGMLEAVKQEPAALGQSVFMVEFPEGGRPGCLAGCVETQVTVGGSRKLAKTLPLE